MFYRFHNSNPHPPQVSLPIGWSKTGKHTPRVQNLCLLCLGRNGLRSSWLKHASLFFSIAVVFFYWQPIARSSMPWNAFRAPPGTSRTGFCDSSRKFNFSREDDDLNVCSVSRRALIFPHARRRWRECSLPSSIDRSTAEQSRAGGASRLQWRAARAP